MTTVNKILKYGSMTLLGMLIYAVMSYIERGYLAAGIEIFFPVMAYVVYKLRQGEKKNE